MPKVIHRRRFIAGAMAAAAVPLSSCDHRLTAGGSPVLVNGDPQWLMRTGDAGAPAVLVLHGGPGASETLLFRHFNRPLEERLQMIYWDQRGAGRSFDPAAPPASLTIAQHLNDLDAVLDHLRGRRAGRIILLGHSWGSALGALYAHARPEKISGFIGVAQVADQAAQELASYRWAFAEARRRGNAKAIAELERIGPPPHDVPALMVKNRWVEKFGGYFAREFGKIGLAARALLKGETSIGEVRRIIRANDLSLDAMWPEVRSLDVAALVPELRCPVALLLGRHDRQCPPSFAADWLQRLRVPSKELIWFERSAHNPPFEEPGKFNETVVRLAAAWAA